MTSVWNNSNANSAIVNTILASPSVQNPSVYSTKEIIPPHAVTYSTIEPSAGSAAAFASNTSASFTLSKFGIVEQIILRYTKSGDGGGATFGVPPGDPFQAIQRVELLSSSRVISTLTRETLICQFANLCQEQLNPILQTVSRALPAAANQVCEFAIPLVFPLLQETDTQMNSTFLEPMTIQVHWGSVGDRLGNSNTTTLSGCQLKVRYKNYPEESTSQILASNFAQPELNMLSSTYYQENTDSLSVTAGQLGTFVTRTIDLRNTDAVESFMILTRHRRVAYVQGAYTDQLAVQSPIGIQRLVLLGSGQEICDLTEALTFHTNLCENGFAMLMDQGAGTTYDYQAVQNFNCGIVSGVSIGVLKDKMTNCLSLREVNAPQLRVTYIVPTAAGGGSAGDTIETAVVEKCLAIYAISSATGRMTLALSN